jgi:hypothetical protein
MSRHGKIGCGYPPDDVESHQQTMAHGGGDSHPDANWFGRVLVARGD